MVHKSDFRTEVRLVGLAGEGNRVGYFYRICEVYGVGYFYRARYGDGTRERDRVADIYGTAYVYPLTDVHKRKKFAGSVEVDGVADVDGMRNIYGVREVNRIADADGIAD